MKKRNILLLFLFALGMIISDGTVTLVKKIQYQLCAPGLETCPGNPDGVMCCFI